MPCEKFALALESLILTIRLNNFHTTALRLIHRKANISLNVGRHSEDSYQAALKENQLAHRTNEIFLTNFLLARKIAAYRQR